MLRTTRDPLTGEIVEGVRARLLPEGEYDILADDVRGTVMKEQVEGHGASLHSAQETNSYNDLAKRTRGRVKDAYSQKELLEKTAQATAEEKEGDDDDEEVVNSDASLDEDAVPRRGISDEEAEAKPVPQKKAAAKAVAQKPKAVAAPAKRQATAPQASAPRAPSAAASATAQAVATVPVEPKGRGRPPKSAGSLEDFFGTTNVPLLSDQLDEACQLLEGEAIQELSSVPRLFEEHSAFATKAIEVGNAFQDVAGKLAKSEHIAKRRVGVMPAALEHISALRTKAEFGASFYLALGSKKRRADQIMHWYGRVAEAKIPCPPAALWACAFSHISNLFASSRLPVACGHMHTTTGFLAKTGCFDEEQVKEMNREVVEVYIADRLSAFGAPRQDFNAKSEAPRSKRSTIPWPCLYLLLRRKSLCEAFRGVRSVLRVFLFAFSGGVGVRWPDAHHLPAP